MVHIVEPSCLRCQTRMEIGFTLDRTDSGSYESLWARGQPERGWFGSLKLNSRKCFPVRTFLCPRCGYLESYVPRAPESAG